MDPIEPQIDINDYTTLKTMRVGTDTVTYANGAASAPSKPRSSFVLPKTGILGRLLVDISAVYDLTIGGGAAAVAADGRGPFGLISRATLSVNGSAAWYNVSGWGSYLLNASEEPHSFPISNPGAAYATAPRNVGGTIYNYPVAADGTANFGVEIPLMLRPDNPLGMLLLQNDQTTVQLDITWANLDSYAALTAGAAATLAITANVTMEYFDVPPRQAFDAYFVSMLRYGHWFDETSQTIAAQGRDANIVTLDNHDTYLKLIHTVILNGVVDTDHVTDVRLTLNRNLYPNDENMATHLRRTRRQIGKDLPAVIWDLFSRDRLRDALFADRYTDIRSVIDISGATLGTNPAIITTTEKLVDLGLPGAVG